MLMMLILFLIMYFAFYPVLNFTFQMIKLSIRNQMRGGRRSKTALAQPKTKELLYDKVKKRMSFTLKGDKRQTLGVNNKLLFIILIASGALIAMTAGYLNNWGLFIASIFVQTAGIVFSYTSSKSIMVAREELLTRMKNLKSERMGLIGNPREKEISLEEEFKVTQWADDYIHPLKMHIYMPTSFDKLKVVNFLIYWNELFSSEGQWVGNLNDEQYKGFDFHSGVASISVTPPLPKMASWHERYLSSDEIAWSFFPMALGSENGVKMLNQETGKYEHVLGFALNNDQKKLSEKNGIRTGADLAAAPHILIAGGTGGGKSLSIDQNVEIVD